MLIRKKQLLRLVSHNRAVIDGLGLDIRIVGRPSALQLLAQKSRALAEEVELLEVLLPMYHIAELRTAQALALQSIDKLLTAAPKALAGSDAKSAQVLLAGLRTRVSEGIEKAGTLSARQQAAQERAIARAAQLLEAARFENIERVASAVQNEIARIMTRKGRLTARQATEKNAFRILSDVLDISDVDAWLPVYRRLASSKTLKAKRAFIKRAGGVNAFGEERFRATMRHQANEIKGLVMEIWFWRSNIWTQWSSDVLARAHRRARQFSAGGQRYEALIISEPLRMLDGGKEIYDGAVLIVRQVSKTPPRYFGYLEAAVQIKAEKRISLLKQIPRDVRRENLVPGKQVLRLDDGTVFDLAPTPDLQDPLRLIVAPELPTFTEVAQGPGNTLVQQVRRLPPGIDLRYAPTLLDAEQLDDVAFALLRAIVDG